MPKTLPEEKSKKLCPDCKIEKPIENFYTLRGERTCKPKYCMRHYSMRQTERNKMKRRLLKQAA